MPTKAELVKQLKETEENERKAHLTVMVLVKKLTELQINYNLLVECIKRGDVIKKLDKLQENLKYVEITIENL